MPVISVRIPQIGEGLQEARLVAVLKQPGDTIKRDEPIYQMETDKAVMDVESPYDGVLVSWLAQPDEILAIGAEVAQMEVQGDVQEMVVHGAPTQAASVEPKVEEGNSNGTRGFNISPRTRAYAKEKGLTDTLLTTLAAGTAKLMPADIDAFLATGGASTPSVAKPYSEAPQAPKQRLLASRLVRGAQLVVPGTMSVAVNWSSIDHCRTRMKASGDAFQPSAFTMFAYAVTQALKDFPMFRSTLVGDDTVRTYHHVQLGIAVSNPGDELVIAVVPDADTLTWHEFADKAREQIKLAREGKDQANESVSISLTNMQSFGILDAIPVVVSPAVATLFLGAVHNALDSHSLELKLQMTANVALTFDHRLINGVGAAEFLNAVKEKVESMMSLINA